MPRRLMEDVFLRDKRVEMLEAFEECVFFRLQFAVDDFGNIDARPAFLKSMLYPTKSVEERQIEAACGKLCAVGLARLYSVDGYEYLHLVGFEAMQKLKHPRNIYPVPPVEEKGEYRGMRWDAM